MAEQSGDRAIKVLLVGSRPRVRVLASILRSPELTLEQAPPTAKAVRTALTADRWDVVVFDGASMKKSFAPLVGIQSLVPLDTLLLYVGAVGAPPDHLLRAFRWVDDVVRHDELFEVALARRVENAVRR